MVLNTGHRNLSRIFFQKIGKMNAPFFKRHLLERKSP
jgi:hypothetical protein